MSTTNPRRHGLILLAALGALTTLGAHAESSRANILFVILKDVGADQLSIKNPSNLALARIPTIEAIAS